MTNFKSALSMQIAHKLFKAGNALFGDCLKKAWAIVKGNITTAILMLKRSHRTTVDVCRHIVTGATILSVKVEKRVLGIFHKTVSVYKSHSCEPWDLKVTSSYCVN